MHTRRATNGRAVVRRGVIIVPILCLLSWMSPPATAAPDERAVSTARQYLGTVMWVHHVMRIGVHGKCRGTGCWNSARRATKQMRLTGGNWLHLDRSDKAAIRFNGHPGEAILHGPLDMTVQGYENTHPPRTPVGDVALARVWAGPRFRITLVLHRGQLVETVPTGRGVSVQVKGTRVSVPLHRGIAQVEITAGKRAGTVATVSGTARVQGAGRTLSVTRNQQVTVRAGEPRNRRPVRAARGVAWLRAVPPTLFRETMPVGEVGVPYFQREVISGTGPFGWRIGGGHLPTGLRLTATGLITGIPGRAGTASVYLTVTDSHALSTTRSVTIPIIAHVAVSPPPPAEGEVGLPYAESLAAHDGAPPYRWILTGGHLPAGVELSAEGNLRGTPRQAGSSQAAVTVADAHGASATEYLTITIAPRLRLRTKSLPSGEVNVPYRQTLAATGGAPPYRWTVKDGGLPDGLHVTRTGAITGTPEQAGTGTVTLAVRDGDGARRTSRVSLAIVPQVTVSTPPIPPAEVGAPYHLQFQAAQGSPPYRWAGTVAGCGGTESCPGLAVGPDGSLGGQPSAPGIARVRVTVTDALGGSATAEYEVAISRRLSAATQQLDPGCVLCGAQPQQLLAQDGVSPYSWEKIGGTAPVALSPAGVLTQNASAQQGTYTLVVRVTDALGVSAVASYTYVVLPPRPKPPLSAYPA